MKYDPITKVTTWQMTPEELAAYRAKYPPKAKQVKRAKDWKRITKEIYLQHRKNGLSKMQIVNKYSGLTIQILEACIERWGVEDK